MLIDPLLLARHWPVLALLTAVAMAGKAISVSLASMLVGERPNLAVKTGFAMAQVGTWSILFAQVGGTGSLVYSLAVALKAITAMLCPLMIRASDPAADWIDRHLPMPVCNALSRYDARLARIRKSPEPEVTEQRETG
jgi:monovalent cation:H+ antiporter-2, CPA2 family